MTKTTALELFTQHNENQILDITKRTIFGAGLRFKVYNDQKKSLYIGNSFLIDFERSKFLDKTFRNFRNSLYIASVLKLYENKVIVTNTTYWQPNYNDFDDYNLFEQLKVDFLLSKKSSFFVLLDYQLNRKTPLNDDQYFFKTQLGISIDIY